MNEEYLDEDGYPTEATLTMIKEWEPKKMPLAEFLNLLESIWYLNS